MKHAVVIGGTGMLAGVVQSLITDGYYCTVVARNPYRLEKLRVQLGEQVKPVSVDYTGTNTFKRILQQNLEKLGPPSLAVAWIHNSAPEAIDILTGLIGNDTNPPRVFHVLGSAAEGPEQQNISKREELRQLKTVRYREIVLGFEIEQGEYSRWLNHDEIAAGVVDSISNDLEMSIIGQVQPWAMRP